MWTQTHLKKIKDKLNKKKKGVLSIPFVIACLAALVLFITILNEYNNVLIVRNLEATSDLAAVESLRAYIDEESLRDEKLEIKEENLPEIRKLFLKKVRENLPSHSYGIIRIEIPTVAADGTIVIPDNYKDVDNQAIFPNSEDAAFAGPYATNSGARTEYLVGGDSTDVAAMSIVKDTTNLATSGEKKKTSYILTAKVTVLYKVNPLFNTIRTSLLNYVDILSDQVTSISTEQVDKNTMAVTIQAIGKVTLR